MSRLNQCRAARSYPKCKCFICQQEEIGRLEAQLKPLRELAEELITSQPKSKPDWCDAHDSGNYDDCESNGYDICAWEYGEKAREALKGGTSGTE